MTFSSRVSFRLFRLISDLRLCQKKTSFGVFVEVSLEYEFGSVVEDIGSVLLQCLASSSEDEYESLIVSGECGCVACRRMMNGVTCWRADERADETVEESGHPSALWAP